MASTAPPRAASTSQYRSSDMETMVKKGIISRPEFSDAAMGSRADCIMVNKGNYILHALHTLNDILVRMQAHQRKKQSLMRALHW